MPDVELVLREYAKTMGAAQHFESTLQALAALEIGMPAGELSSEEVQQRMVRFFSRGIGWIAQRLDLIPVLAEEINALRQARNELAHDYLVFIGRAKLVVPWAGARSITRLCSPETQTCQTTRHIAKRSHGPLVPNGGVATAPTV